MTHEDYISFKQAKLLKKLGFDWECDHWYTSDKELCYSGCYEFDPIVIMAPTLYQVQKWLREVKDIIIGIDFDNWYEKYICHVYKKVISNSKRIKDSYSSMLVTNESGEDFNTYEEALLKGITKALELLKENG